jgi:hypothetical protein
MWPARVALFASIVVIALAPDASARNKPQVTSSPGPSEPGNKSSGQTASSSKGRDWQSSVPSADGSTTETNRKKKRRTKKPLHAPEG